MWTSSGVSFRSLASCLPKLTPEEVHILCEEVLDRKSTRLNSSHGYISYAVFGLKKKTDGVAVRALFLRRAAPMHLIGSEAFALGAGRRHATAGRGPARVDCTRGGEAVGSVADGQ